ncbi:hypothetical protein [Nocardioides sp. CER19]|uniref:hypothetical protein n=1 Tax=Nocardioides sp. CER19 TaxID=3038538 RepID=UPI00244C7BF7|nr:hypothetical protein [Nocardioides sp. CER19]MDH2415499.1 hypothetical protein [Nocardioides sp. CER19]
MTLLLWFMHGGAVLGTPAEAWARRQPSLSFDYVPADVLARAEWALKDRRQAMLEEYDLALAWADLHGEPPAVEVEGGDRLVRLGGLGTPLVRDLCLEELAVARSEHVHATRSLLADLLDLRHRLPRLWVAVQGLRVEPWVARKIASLSRRLDRDAVALVDVAVAEAVGLSHGRLLELAEAKIIEADTAARATELADARLLKGAWVTGTRHDAPAGLRDVFARIEAADAVWLDATLQRVADLLATDPDRRATHHPELGPTPTRDELRAAAFGWLARPHDLADLLGLLDTQADDQQQNRQSRQGHRRRAVLFVHLHQSALHGASGVARSTTLGPLLLDQVRHLLRHAHVDLTPVIDLNTGASVNGYEHPEAVKQRTLLRTLVPAFPHATGTEASRVDHDHAVPYDPLGPPGQTGDHNDAPLTRHNHRAKTHLGYQVRQLAPGTYLWTTPRGLHRLVNHTGTHHLTDDDLDLIRRIHAA